MGFKRVAGTVLCAGALSAGALGVGLGTAQADDDWVPWVPNIPNIDRIHWNPLPPGQVKQLCPWHSPPGHWIGGPHGIPCT
ncbi:hypothetical protein [Mycolicibacterium confluentis]|uniref:Uncharacterized protein n=1 Tax=Mycolicibacterium confluentis TaxID=28047 RepID=A0A7I7Y5Y8_9MYCO|nr:hypothetical protein [Mycolicibacterium confluentis]MCV7319091.1 hypothetical protein [Mycolicibacterium confluentis]ORV24815.1 hypothetical protein AWB99_04780 [Mycolicibacterium confluentis]BBZ36704.1 hypothetical protein MCNF_53090 [Mycolicibacterium confluentis]